MRSVRYIYFGEWVTDFLHYILHHDAPTILLVICSTRDAFTKQLFATVHAQSVDTVDDHQLLTKTIGLLSKSSKINTVFCPTLEHLRAFLSVPRATDSLEQQTRPPLMAILDPLVLHLSTFDFSAQGLSRTLAAAAETSSRDRMDLVLCECRDATNPADGQRGEALWHVNVPLLNSCVRMGGEESPRIGRSVPVKRIVQRWFEFNEPSHFTTDTMVA